MTRTLAFALFLLPLTASLASAADLTVAVSDVHSSPGSNSFPADEFHYRSLRDRK